LFRIVNCACASFPQESDVREIFAPFGAIDLVQIQRDGAGKSQGHAYVTCVCCVCSLSAFALFALCSLLSLLSALVALCLRLLSVCVC